MANKFTKEFKLKAVKAWFKIGGALTPRLAARVAYGAFFIRPFRHKPLPSDLALIRTASIIDLNFENHLIRGYSWGNGEKLVLLVHGWSSHALTMRKFIPALTDQGYTVIAFDAPSHGNSEGVKTSGLEYRRFLRQIITTYKPCAIIAHSLGGICSLCELAELQDVDVQKVVTLAVPITSTMMVYQFLKKAKLHRSAHGHFDKYIERKLGVIHNEFDLTQIYQNNIPFKGMIVHDAKDNLIPFLESIKLAKIWPQAKILTTHGLGHSGVLKDKSVVNQVVDFINE